MYSVAEADAVLQDAVIRARTQEICNDASPLRRALREHFSKYGGLTEVRQISHGDAEESIT